MTDDYEFWLEERETFRRLAKMGRDNFHAWVCPKCGSLQRSPARAHIVPTCCCGETMPAGQPHERRLHREAIGVRVPTCESCQITDRTNEIARRLVGLALDKE